MSGASGTYVVDGIQVGSTPADAGPCELWVVATKASDVDAVVGGIVPLLRPTDVVMPFQNGLGSGERVARHVPEEQIIIGIAEGFGSSIPEPGYVHHNGMRLIRIGEMRGGLTDRVQRIEGIWRDAGFNVRSFADIDRMVWEKFLCNVTLSAPTAAFDVTVGELMANPETWAVALGLHDGGLPTRAGDGRHVLVRRPRSLRHRVRSHHPRRQPVDAPRPPGAPSLRGGRHQRAGRRARAAPAGLEAPYNEALCAVLRTRESRFPTES